MAATRPNQFQSLKSYNTLFSLAMAGLVSALSLQHYWVTTTTYEINIVRPHLKVLIEEFAAIPEPTISDAALTDLNKFEQRFSNLDKSLAATLEISAKSIWSPFGIQDRSIMITKAACETEKTKTPAPPPPEITLTFCIIDRANLVTEARLDKLRTHLRSVSSDTISRYDSLSAIEASQEAKDPLYKNQVRNAIKKFQNHTTTSPERDPIWALRFVNTKTDFFFLNLILTIISGFLLPQLLFICASQILRIQK